MTPVWFDLDPMPSPRPRVTQHGTYMPSQYTSHVEALVWLLVAAKRRGDLQRIEAGPVGVELVVALVRPTSARKRAHPCVRPDLDNYTKTVLDAATRAGLWTDDGQVVELRARKAYADKAGYALAVWRIE